MGLSQQLDSRRNLSRIILYVSGGWLSCLFLDITPTQLYSEAYITEQEIRVCPAALLERTRRESLHHNILLKRSHSRLLPILFDIAGYSDSFMGGWLGHFSDRQCTLIGSLGPVLWDTVVSPLWGINRLITARLHLREQPLHASLFPVTPAINDAGSTRVLMKESSTTLKDIAGAGSSGNLGDCWGGSRGVHAADSYEKTAQLLQDM